ncbi:MAG: DUF1343 domain-containing protein [Anaerolinea sp.]|nr:DUF1343 domain-containing protein [Anaerolinea sp.]
MKLGIDVLRAQDFAAIRGRRVGLMTNLNVTDSQLAPTYEVFRRAGLINALLAPEHGLTGSLRDGELIASGIDARSGVPMHSLYADSSFRPKPEIFTGLDVVVCDIPDVGARYYTFLWSLSHLLEVLGERGIKVIVLDRPNPLGDRIAGSPLRPEVASIVGRFNVPICHGMTVGELALMFNDKWSPTPCDLEVIRCADWQRHMTWDQVGMPFVPASPAMPHFVTAQHYPGACLVEGTNFSEGRGTVLPFEIVGAPFVDAFGLADALNALSLAGVIFRPHSFRPSSGKFAGEMCYGVHAHIVDAHAYDPITVWLHVIRHLRAAYPDQFEWKRHFDLLIGSTGIRAQLDRGVPVSEIMAGWSDFHAEFRDQRAPYLLYE